MIAWGLDFLAYWTKWKTIATEDPDERSKMAKEAMQFYEKAQHHYSIILFTSPRWGVMSSPAGHAEHYFDLASWAINPKKRWELLEKSETAGMKALGLAEDSDLPLVVSSVSHVISKTLEARARNEPDLTKKSAG